MDWRPLLDIAARGYAPTALLDVGAHIGSFSKAFLDVFPGCKPVLIEPNPHCGPALTQLPFEWHAFAASNETGEAELHLTSEWLQSTGASLYRENTHFFRDEVLQRVKVARRRLDDMFPTRRFDVVKIDVQGAELDVIRGGAKLLAKADYVLAEVSLVNYNEGGARAEDIFAELSRLGFLCAGVLEFHRLKGVANGALLQMDFLFENQSRRARSSLLRAAGLAPPDPQAIEALVTQDLAAGDVASALETLLKTRNASVDFREFLPLLQTAMSPAIQRVNAHFDAGQWAEAAAIAGPMAMLLPNYAPGQRVAMTAFACMSDAQKAGEFAQRLLDVDPHDQDAVRIKKFAQIVEDAKPAERDPARLALFPAPSRHPLLTLRDAHDATTAVLCKELDSAHVPRLDAYQNLADNLSIDMPLSPDFMDWVRHFRAAMDAMRVSRILSPLAPSALTPPNAFAAMSGDRLSQADFVAAIASRNPQAVFFVAADIKYVGLYANHYVKSVTQNCDVPYAIVVHVIGGAGRLHDIAASLDPAAQGVFLTGDNFDAAAVATKCVDAPPKGVWPHPAAHFQSVRFQRLGWLLDVVKVPVFVSDIDLLLQRGVADLLEREAASDIVLNENGISASCGSRYTANLLLLNPTPVAAHFAASLKAYLDDMLSQPEVSRWIDQFGLLMARHRLLRDRPGARIGYFDTSSDINNLMYRTFQQNPFRFLSLYHGFDMDSLKSAA